jgi:uncharacterized membrane protein
MTLLMKLLHVVTAFWFIGGLLGRTVIMWQAARTTDVRMVEMLVRVAGYFERWMVIPGSLAVLGFGLAAAWLQRWPMFGGATWLLLSTVLYLSLIPVIAFIFVPRGKIFDRVLQTAIAQGEVTADLSAAFRDRVVGLAHAYELAATAVVIVLMVFKPF